jgi:hypothetical protein
MLLFLNGLPGKLADDAGQKMTPRAPGLSPPLWGSLVPLSTASSALTQWPRPCS